MKQQASWKKGTTSISIQFHGNQAILSEEKLIKKDQIATIPDLLCA